MTATSRTSGPLGSPLARVQARDASADHDLAELRRGAWRRQGIAVFRLGDIRDDGLRQAVRNEAERLYGKREGE